MRLRVLGSSGAYPRADNPSTGFVLETAAGRLWLDAGTGTFAALQRAGVPFTRLEALVLSHLHADHCLDVFPLYYALRFTPGEGWGSERRLPVYAPPGARETLSALLAPDDAATFARVLEFREIDEGSVVEAAGLRLSFLRTRHPIHTLAVRMEDGGAVLTYSADTGPGTDLSRFARGSDLLLCEATYQNARLGGPLHLSAAQAAETAVAAGARALALTHLWPDLDPEVSLAEARAVASSLPVQHVRMGDELGVGR
ncbi:MAG TPA: MBL fold metallo-hydrolase [Thermoanaerobaculia bacterium]|nr:MBL fold metallo-hydrolase [Thermoanaerobaculia bacterium]